MPDCPKKIKSILADLLEMCDKDILVDALNNLKIEPLEESNQELIKKVRVKAPPKLQAKRTLTDEQKEKLKAGRMRKKNNLQTVLDQTVENIE